LPVRGDPRRTLPAASRLTLVVRSRIEWGRAWSVCAAEEPKDLVQRGEKRMGNKWGRGLERDWSATWGFQWETERQLRL
jgi:hypothetical protein